MKRLIYILSLLLCLCLLFSGCNLAPSDPVESESEGTNLTETTENTETIKTTESETEAKETDIAPPPTVTHYEPSGYTKKSFAIKDERVGVILSLPDEWKITATSGREYSITRKGEIVGAITSREIDSSGWAAFASDEQLINDVKVLRVLETKDGEFRYRFTYTYDANKEKRVFTLTADYSEISDSTMIELFEPKKDDFMTDGGFSMLEGGDEYSSILIIGNSFVGTSDIGEMLEKMFFAGGKRCKVTAISRGYALVSTYTADSTIMSDIWYGKYDAVFMCGLYNGAQINEIYTLKRYCKTSDTALVVFPAHNEERLVINKAMLTYDDLILLDWKAEIEALISNGVNRWDLCYDDEHDHSKPTAGYVGAHMIYRAMYGEIPPAIIGNINGYTQAHMNTLLGDYVTTGKVQLTERSDVYVFIP